MSFLLLNSCNVLSAREGRLETIYEITNNGATITQVGHVVKFLWRQGIKTDNLR
jgi:hypothetical protein